MRRLPTRIFGRLPTQQFAHTGDTGKITHNKMARDWAKIANESSFPLHLMNQNYYGVMLAGSSSTYQPRNNPI